MFNTLSWPWGLQLADTASGEDFSGPRPSEVVSWEKSEGKKKKDKNKFKSWICTVNRYLYDKYKETFSIYIPNLKSWADPRLRNSRS